MQMNSQAAVRYFGWSSLAVSTATHTLFFDPFYRRYCGAEWFSEEDFADADYIAVTHGHEEHFLDVPELAKRTGATVIGPAAAMRFLQWRHRLPASQMLTAGPRQHADVPGFKIETFGWKHRDINLYSSVTKALLRGNTTQLAWAWSSATRAPFYAPYTGYMLTLPDGLTIMNYSEGFNTKMTDREIQDLGQRFRIDVLLAGMQLDFVDDVRRGVAALKPGMVLLYPPHEKFHEMMGAISRPWSEFVAAAQAAAPQARVVSLAPGTQVNLGDGTTSQFQRRLTSLQADRDQARVHA
jgi:L-ascorbate metabolism protein UlaG (beta-lactamase superfamily)